MALVWPLAIVGAQQRAAYYVSALDLKEYLYDLGHRRRRHVDRRGHDGDGTDPTLKINHPMHLIQHFKDTVPGYSDQLVDRLDWAHANASIIGDCNVQVRNAKVTKVRESPLPEPDPGDAFGFEIQLE